MKKHFLLLLLFTGLCGFSQTTYQPGYFISNDGTRTECLIKNIGWKNNPESFDYKLSENGEVQEGNITQVKEFSAGEAYTYRRYTVNIDRSVNLTDQINTRKQPQWHNETLFLKLLVEGKANLYSYDDDNIEKYFYSSGDHTLAEQLFYKQYRIDNKIYENNQFRGQLYALMKDEYSDLPKFKSLDYDDSELVKLFREYDGLNGKQVKDLTATQNKAQINLKVTAGADYASLNISRDPAYDDAYYTFNPDNKAAPKAGLEFEYIFGFNNNKWSLFLNPEATFYKTKATHGNYNWDVSYTFVEIPFGVRYYMFLNKNSKLFVNMAYIVNFPMGKSTLKYSYVDSPYDPGRRVIPFELTKSASACIGAGYAYNDFSAQVRYSFQSRITHNSDYIGAHYQAVSLILGYKLF